MQNLTTDNTQLSEVEGLWCCAEALHGMEACVQRTRLSLFEPDARRSPWPPSRSSSRVLLVHRGHWTRSICASVPANGLRAHTGTGIKATSVRPHPSLLLRCREQARTRGRASTRRYFRRRADFQFGACHSQTWTSSNAFGRTVRPISMLADSGVAG